MESPVCVVGYYREVTIPALPDTVSVQLDSRTEVRDSATTTNGSKQHTRRLKALEDRPAVFRTGGAARPVLGSFPLRGMRLRFSTETGAYEIHNPVIVDTSANVRISFEILIGGACFDNGSVVKEIFVPSDLDDSSSMVLTYLKSGDAGSLCHRVRIFQGDYQIAYFQ
jgi:hypothetical protein